MSETITSTKNLRWWLDLQELRGCCLEQTITRNNVEDHEKRNKDNRDDKQHRQ